MMTIVTHVTLKEGSEPEWDAAMRARLGSVRGRRGWICTQLLIPNDGMNKRVIIGTWQTRADWEAWHRDPAFAETRARLDGLEAAPRQEWWHEVILDVRASELDGLHGAVGHGPRQAGVRVGGHRGLASDNEIAGAPDDGGALSDYRVSSTSRTLRARLPGVNGFCKSCVPGSSVPCGATAAAG